MKRARLIAPILILALVASCASVGTGDKLVVRAEDTLANSLSTYDALMTAHQTNSKNESPATYRAIEDVRVKFPGAWRAVNEAKKSYQAGIKGGADTLSAALDALDALVAQAGVLSAGR
jgi:hypothetical protein